MFPMHQAAQPIQVNWQAQEVVRAIDRKPHLLLRVTLTGGPFPQRALAPFVRLVVGESQVTRAWFTEISEDSNELRAYFPIDVSLEGTIEYGYGPVVYGRGEATFDGAGVKRLERERLPKNVVDTTREYLAKRSG